VEGEYSLEKGTIERKGISSFAEKTHPRVAHQQEEREIWALRKSAGEGSISAFLHPASGGEAVQREANGGSLEFLLRALVPQNFCTAPRVEKD